MGNETKALPPLERGYSRELLTVQGEFMGQRIESAAWVDYEMVNEPSLSVEADDVCVVGVWSADGDNMLEHTDTDAAAYLSRCAARAAAGHEYALYAEKLASNKDYAGYQ